MSDGNRRAWTATVFLAMALGGAVLQMRGAVLPTLMETFRTPEWQLGLVAPAGTIGYVLVILVTGFGAGYLSPKRIVALGLVGGGLSVVLMGLSPLFAVFVVGVGVQAAMNGLMRGLNRPLLSHFYPTQRGRVFSYYDMTWAAGAMIGPLLIVAALAVGTWRVAYLGLAVVWFALGLFVLTLANPPASTEEKRIQFGDVPALLRRPEVLAMGAAMALGTGVEGSLFTWLPIYATQAMPETATIALAGFELTIGLAEVTLSVMLAGYIPGRFAYATLSEHTGYARLLVGIVLLLVPVYATTFVLLEGVAILVGVFATGTLISGLYPMLVTYATEATPHHSGPVTALAATTSALGIGIVPALVGGVISARGAAVAMELLLIPLVGVLVIVALARLGELRAAERRVARTK